MWEWLRRLNGRDSATEPTHETHTDVIGQVERLHRERIQRETLERFRREVDDVIERLEAEADVLSRRHRKHT